MIRMSFKQVYPYNDTYFDLFKFLSFFFRCDRYAAWFFFWIHKTSSMAESTSQRLSGRMTSKRTLSCDRVIDGAFFPQSYFEMPEEKMSKHRCQHMVVPSGVFSNFVMIHAKFRFGFLKALFDGPSDATQPDKKAQPSTIWGIAQIIFINRLILD